MGWVHPKWAAESIVRNSRGDTKKKMTMDGRRSVDDEEDRKLLDLAVMMCSVSVSRGEKPSDIRQRDARS